MKSVRFKNARIMSLSVQNEKKEWISKAKGFGILGVVAVHTVQRFSVSTYLSCIAYAGMYCVQLFFVISAYLTFVSLENNLKQLTLRTYLKYFGHKLVRLVPILYTAVLWHILHRSVLMGKVPEINASIWKDAFFALTFLNGFSYRHINPWANWYIGDLVIFWAVSPLLFRWINSPKKSVWFFVVTMLFGWLSYKILHWFGVDTSWFFYFWFPRQLPVLAIGIMFYHFQKYPFGDSKKSIRTLAFVVSVCLLLSFFYTTPMELHVRYGLFLLVFVYTLFNYSGKWFNWLKVLGDNSYGIYLYHVCLITVFDTIVRRYDINSVSVTNFVGYYILLILISLLISIIANMVFEKPFFRFMRRKFGV